MSLSKEGTRTRNVQTDEDVSLIGGRHSKGRNYIRATRCCASTSLILVLILGVCMIAYYVGSGGSIVNKSGPYVNMGLIADVPNALSTTMNKAFSRSTYGWIPADPHLAVGKETVIVMSNAVISIYDKKTLERTAGPIDGIDFYPTFTDDDFVYFDQYGVYDHFDNRIWINGLTFASGAEVRVGICVSKTHSPRIASDFYCYHYDLAPEAEFVDYPKVSVDATGVYISSTDFFDYDPPNGIAQRLRVFDKKPLMDGTSPVSIIPMNTMEIDPVVPYSVGEYGGNLPWPAQFSNPRSTDRVKQVVYTHYSKNGATDDASGMTLTGTKIAVGYVSDPLGTATFHSVDVDVPEFTINGISNYGFATDLSIGPKQPPPLIPSSINETLHSVSNYAGILMSPVLFRDHVYIVHEVSSGGPSPRSVIRWYEVDVSRLISYGEASLVQFGTIDDGIHDLFYPAVSVDKHGGVAFGFSMSSPFQYVKPGYTGRLKGDPVGTVRMPLRELAPGDHYYQAVANGRNRYGDFSGLTIDPVDGETHWIFNQYTYRIPQDPRYNFGTAWNTKLASFKLEKTGGASPNAPQTENFFGGTAADVPPSAKRFVSSRRKSKPRAPHKRMEPNGHMKKWIQHHSPHGEGCHRVNNRVVCPPMQGE